jgi:hypothetical protein
MEPYRDDPKMVRRFWTPVLIWLAVFLVGPIVARLLGLW